jgi:ribonuclease T1
VRLPAGLLALFFAVSAFAFSSGTIEKRQLPKEAIETIALIRQGGPFRHERDGVTFGNRERLLPARERGWYREYTVRTPGERTRGARRIVAGRDGTLYYTDDHYRSFKRILE